MDRLSFVRENHKRIQELDNSFGPSGQPLSKPGRVLMGEGRLVKQGRRKPQRKSFFLFNDVLVYGSRILNGRLHKKQKIIPLEGIQLQDMEDGVVLRNQWMIRTPRKSFIVSAPSLEEKQAWMDHILDCQASLLRDGSYRPVLNFAVSWIPDQAAYKCMRCFGNFTVTNRRHHCRKCGFLVCNSCSKERAVIVHIHPTKKQRICILCHNMNTEDELSRLRVNSAGKNSSGEEEEFAASSDEEEETVYNHIPSSWLDFQSGTWEQLGTYIDLRSVQ